MNTPGPLLECLDLAPGDLGVAVSGGSDSIALLLLLHDRAVKTGTVLRAVTVDHGLRDESASEAADVARFCGELGVKHTILRWEDREAGGNLQASARNARYSLITSWANERGVRSVALGHTSDDQAETFLLRLARGSGVDGLSGMAGSVFRGGVWWLRPMLSLRREDLRTWLRGRGVAWAEDPGNQDRKYARIRAREAIRRFHDLGIRTSDLTATTERMARARSALEHYAAEHAVRCLECRTSGEAVLDINIWARSPDETRLRVMAAALGWVSGAFYRPRFSALQKLAHSVSERAVGAGLTLHGCVLRQRGERLLIRREYGLVAPPVLFSQGVWDNRWIWSREPRRTCRVGAFGTEGLAQVPNWKEQGVPREVLITTPAAWEGDVLLEAPVAGIHGPTGIKQKTMYPEMKQQTL